MNGNEILPADIRREDELLLRSLRRFFTGDAQDRIEDLPSSDMDWPYLLQNASRHGVMPILYRYFEALGWQSLPEEAMNQMQESFRDNSIHNLSLTGELVRLLALFKAHAIPAMPFKGPVLAARLYGDLALRQSVDLDILIPRADLFRAVEIIQAQGYINPYRLSERQEEAFLRSRHHINLCNRELGLSIEVHWRISPGLCLMQTDMERLWRCTEEGDFLGRKVLSLTSEDMLLVLCDHGARHGWKRLAWICDIARLIEAEGIDWPWVFERAQREGSQRSVLMALSLADMLLGSPLPEEVQKKIQADPSVGSLALRVIDHLFKDRSALEEEDPLGGPEG